MYIIYSYCLKLGYKILLYYYIEKYSIYIFTLRTRLTSSKISYNNGYKI